MNFGIFENAKVFGSARIVRSIPQQEGKIFLTFDDGPDPHSTPLVLDTLAKHEKKATFFVIAEKAQAYPHLLRRMKLEGHSIGSHSLNHGYLHYFRGKNKIKNWIVDAEKKITEITEEPTVGFRPPAGVWTPELRWALQELRTPLILWNTRFFDTFFEWTSERARRSLSKTSAGSIILLHDLQAIDKLPLFLATLSDYMGQSKAAGFDFQPLNQNICMKAAGFSETQSSSN